MSKAKSETQSIFQLNNPWERHSHHVWLASTLSLARNLKKFKFPPKLDKTREEQVFALLREELIASPELKSPQTFKTSEISPLEKEFLLEHFLVSDGLYQARGNEGFVLDASGSFMGILNVRDHLQLLLLDTHQEIEKAWNRLVKIEGSLSKALTFAFQPRFGFLTADPRLSGTGLSIKLYLHIPAIIHMGELAELLEREKEEEVEAVGLQGKTTEMIGDILVAQNRCTLGLTEEYILTTMRMWATRAVVAEISLRKKLAQHGNEAIKNKVTRALGLLTHSYQLDAIEAFNALSLVKLGVEIGWVTKPADLNLNALLFNSRRAHLVHTLGGNISIPDLPRKRAEWMHQIASRLKLAI